MTTLLKIVPELRNQVINGSLDFWQRGTSFSLTNAASTNMADRFQWYTGGTTATATGTQQTDVPTQAQSGFSSKYSLRIATTNQVASPGASAGVGVVYKVEGQDYQQLHGTKVRLQFWAKTSVVGTYSVCFQNGAQTRAYVSSYSLPTVNWTKISLDITLDTASSGWNFDNTIGLDILFTLQAGSGAVGTANIWSTVSAGALLGVTGTTNLWAGTAGATFQLAQVALYPIAASSGIDLPFYRAGRTIGHELAMCQRYFFSLDADANSGVGGSDIFLPMQATSTTTALGGFAYPVTMRGAPSVTSVAMVLNTAAGANAGSVTALTVRTVKNWASLTATIASGIVAGNCTVMSKNASSTSTVNFDAEL